MRFDLHVHSTYSKDGLSTQKMIIRTAIRRGLSGVAITDHNCIAAAPDVPEGFIIIPGVEYSTDYGHILALFCKEFAAGLARDSLNRFSLAELAPFVRDRGGLLIAAHPYRYKMYQAPDEPFGLPAFLLENVDGLESVNARDLIRDPDGQAKVEQAAQACGLFVTGGSDGHFPLEIGGGYTEIPDGAGLPDGTGLPGGTGLPDGDVLRNALLEKKSTAAGKPGRKIYSMTSRIWKKIRRKIQRNIQ